jgi:hypothetical protein
MRIEYVIAFPFDDEGIGNNGNLVFALYGAEAGHTHRGG